MARRLSSSVACGIFPDQRSNPRLPFWQEDSLPRSQQSFFKDIDPLLQTIFSKVFPKPCQSFFFCLLSHFPLFLYIYASFVYNFPVIICNTTSAAATAKSLQSCLTLCDPIDGSPTGSPVPGILQVRTLEWVAISFFNAWKWKVKVKSLSRVRLLVTPWTAAYQAPPSMGFSRQEYWSGVPLPSLNTMSSIVFVKFRKTQGKLVFKPEYLCYWFLWCYIMI